MISRISHLHDWYWTDLTGSYMVRDSILASLDVPYRLAIITEGEVNEIISALSLLTD